MGQIENQFSSFVFRFSRNASGTSSLPNLIEGSSVRCNIPLGRNVLIKNIRANSWYLSTGQSNNSLLESGDGSFFFTARFLVNNTVDFLRSNRGEVTYPGGFPTPVFGTTYESGVGSDTLEYIVNTAMPELKELNLIANGITLTQLGYSIPLYIANQPLFINLVIEYQDIIC